MMDALLPDRLVVWNTATEGMTGVEALRFAARLMGTLQRYVTAEEFEEAVSITRNSLHTP